jgi:hypothetical protein
MPWQRIGFVIAGWAAMELLTIPVMFTIGLVLYSAGERELIDRAVYFSASLPVVIYGMRQSHLFVSVQQEDRQSELTQK